MGDGMEKERDLSGSGSPGVAKEPGRKGREAAEPCEKAFNQETARLKDADEACDDGVG
jgi:hypothetical protein